MKRILVAEDNDSNYILMSYILRKSYEIARAVNGQEAVDMVAKEKFDMVLMDLQMPVMDGLTATKIIKSTHPELPVLAVTANVFGSDREAALAAGCDEFITKPVNAAGCLEIIAGFFK